MLRAQVSKAVKALGCSRRIALSGTPVENRLAELHSLVDFALPGYPGTAKQFNAAYAKVRGPAINPIMCQVSSCHRQCWGHREAVQRGLRQGVGGPRGG